MLNHSWKVSKITFTKIQCHYRLRKSHKASDKWCFHFCWFPWVWWWTLARLTSPCPVSMNEISWLKGRNKSSKPSGFSLAFHKFKDVSNSHGAFDVSDQMTLIGFFTRNQNNFYLGDSSSWSCSSQKLCDSSFDGFRLHVVIIISINIISIINFKTLL